MTATAPVRLATRRAKTEPTYHLLDPDSYEHLKGIARDTHPDRPDMSGWQGHIGAWRAAPLPNGRAILELPHGHELPESVWSYGDTVGLRHDPRLGIHVPEMYGDMQHRYNENADRVRSEIGNRFAWAEPAKWSDSASGENKFFIHSLPPESFLSLHQLVGKPYTAHRSIAEALAGTGSTEFKNWPNTEYPKTGLGLTCQNGVLLASQKRPKNRRLRRLPVRRLLDHLLPRILRHNRI
jgi:hypothetical protein